MKKPEILIVDDEPINLSYLKNLLSPSYTIKVCKSGNEALRVASMDPIPDFILMDIIMPGMDGYATLSKMRYNPKIKDIPVIYTTSLDRTDDEERGLKFGAVDYITKPFKPAIILARVRVHLELKQAKDKLKDQNLWLEREVNKRVEENLLIQDATLSVITQLVETRDNETANHILRTRSYVEILARRLQNYPKYTEILSEDILNTIVKASSLHDIGKIGIRDSILLKPGKLTFEEFEVMKTHCLIGANAIQAAMDKVLKMLHENDDAKKSFSFYFFEEALNIVSYHHEKWDGTGYPDGLKGEEIPLSARLMAIADVFDALTTPRIYKEPWKMEDAIGWICQQRGLHFAPDVVDAFEKELQAFLKVFRSMHDNRER